jgi:deazaflavin-dependent oxidoreductase (nitroreductase family)
LVGYPGHFGTLRAAFLEVVPMPAPRWLARFNRVGTNRLTRHVAPWLPGFGVVIHTGRKSGTEYRTPVNVFAREGGFVIALTYGRESEWVRNVLASGGCRLETRRRIWQLGEPNLLHDEQRRAVPVPVRIILGLLKVNDFLELEGVDRLS